VAELALPDQWPADRVPVQLADVLPVHARTAEEKVAELRRLQQLKAMLAGYELDLVAALAGDRPATFDRAPGRPGAAADGPAGAPAGVSEFFADELALVLNAFRAAASTLIDQATTLTEVLPATRAALAEGRLDWPRARAIAGELGWKARATDPAIIAQVKAAVLPRAGRLSIRRLIAAVQAELAARDA
ncbi:13E12 repeat family protein, partial [Geodermatophilus sp. CPCC 205506]